MLFICCSGFNIFPLVLSPVAAHKIDEHVFLITGLHGCHSFEFLTFLQVISHNTALTEEGEKRTILALIF